MTTTKLTKRKTSSNQKNDNETKQPQREQASSYRYGPMPRFSSQRLWSRGIIIVGLLLYVWYNSSKGRETILAKQTDILSLKGQKFECHPNYLAEINKYPDCTPKKCGRFVSDHLVTATEAETLLNVAKRGISLGGSHGGASILDLHSGALSMGDRFINISSLDQKFMNNWDYAIYKHVREKIQRAVADNFNINYDSLYLTHPTFFSRMDNKDPVTAHDEYWHIHIDKDTYESFHYTTLLYLSDYNIDFKGGRFIFLDDPYKPMKNTSIEPRKGRVSIFTSGGENPHHVERVTFGTRYAITVSFTCDSTKAITNPNSSNSE